MCFSAEASFGASIALTAIGVATFKKAGKSELRWLAMIPLMFGIQQFMEGLVWIAFLNEEYSGLLNFGTVGFLIFAWIIWPVYLPLSLWKLERNYLRKIIMSVLLITGVFVAFSLVYVLIFKGVRTSVLDCSIKYEVLYKHPLSWVFSILYLLTTVLPNLVSGYGKMWLLGLLNLITYLFTKIYYDNHVISIWCFLAGITSIVIYYIVWDLKRSEVTGKH